MSPNISSVQYKPWSAIQQFSMGNGLTENWTYNNSRMQPLSVTAMKGSNTLLTLNMWYCTGTSPAQDCSTNNRNVMQAWAGPSATPAYKQTFTYDSLNRLTAAAEGSAWIQSYDGVNRLQASSDSGGWSEQFGYDRYGNVYLSATPSGLPIQTQMPTTVNAYDAATNHLQAGAHDAAGNQTIYGGWQMTYDAENRQIGAYNSTTSTTVSYTYDGAGQRVSKTIAGGATTAYVHDVFGRLAAEYTSAPAPAAPCSTCYLSWDHLGSTRMVTDAGGNVVARHDYLPFGVEIQSGSAGRTSTWGTSDSLSTKFTAQERDSNDTGLDFFQARYHASGQGRFLSPDSLGNFVANSADPQSWNQYAYARNSPLAFIDPSGHDCAYLNDAGDDFEEVDSNSNVGECSDHGGYWVNGQVNQVSVTDSGDYRFSWFGSDNQGTFSMRAYDSYIGPGQWSGFQDTMAASGQAVIGELGNRADASNAAIATFAGTSVLTGATMPLGAAVGGAVNRLAFGPSIGRLFYSGYPAAYAAAGAAYNLGRTIVDTPAGQAYTKVAGSIPASLVNGGWNILSYFWASGAAGTVNAFIAENASTASIWATTELPTLMQNSNIFVPIIYH